MSFAGDLPADGSGLDYSDIGADQRKAAAQLPFSTGLAQTASDAFMGATRGFADYLDLDAERHRAVLDKEFNVDPTEDPGGAMIDPKEWQKQYPDLGLSFTPDMGRAQAQLLVDHRQDELRRQYVIDHSPDTFAAKTARGLTDFAVQAVDPLNIAAAFVPGLGETRASLIAAQLGKTMGRVVEGAVGGAAGMAALTPLQAAEAHAYQDHYGPMDAFLNVAFGTVLGGGLHAGVGAFSDFLGRAAPETREAALRASVAQAVEGRPVDVQPVLSTDPALFRDPDIGTVTEPGSVDTLPVINRADLEAAGREAQLKQDLAGHEQTLADLGEKAKTLQPENPDAVKRLNDLGTVEEKLNAPDLTPEERRIFGSQRDQILTDTNPETLKAQAQPTVDRQALEQQRRLAQIQRDNTGRMLSDVQAQRRQAAVLNAVGPLARSSIDRARQRSIDFARGQEPSATHATPEAVATADATIKAGDDAEGHLADAESRLQAYKAQGILTDAEHAAFTDANTADNEAAKTRADAADAAARCLFLHP